MAGLKPVIKTTVVGVVDIIEEDVLRVEYNSAHFADVRGVNTATVKVNNSGFNGQGKTKKRIKKTSKRKEIDVGLKQGAIGHCKNKVILEPAAVEGNAAIQVFASFTKEQQQILLRVAGEEKSHIGV